MGKFVLYALIVIGASSLMNWTSLGRSAGSGFGGYGSRGGYIGSPGGGYSSGGGGHK